MKKILALLLSLMMLFTAAVALGEDKLPLDGYVVILHTNDVHGGAVATESRIGYSGIALAKNNLEKLGAIVYLMDAGDAVMGEPIVNIGYGSNAVDFMNITGYDVACPGNHEFDWGSENLQEIISYANYEYLCANILSKETGETLFKANTILPVNEDISIGVFALDTPELAQKTNPAKIQDIKVLSEEDMYACAQAQVDELRAAGCTLVVCLGHLGDDNESIPNRSIDVLDNVTGIDLFIDAHSHTVLPSGDETHGDCLRVSAGTKSEYLGYVAYKITTTEDGAPTLERGVFGLVSASDMIASAMLSGSTTIVDDYIDFYVNYVNSRIQTNLSIPFAVSEVDLNGERDPGNRTMETNLGDYATDAILWTAQQYCGENVVAAITNGGGIRASVDAGVITMLDLKTIFPFGNTVAVLTLTGADLLSILEASTFSTPEALGAFPQVSGIEYTVDTSKEWIPGDQFEGKTYYAAAAPGTRVTITSVGGQPFDPDATYTIATNDFMAAGGDTYDQFEDLYKANGIDTGVALEDALINYTTEVLGCVVGQEYAEPQGRITIK